MDGLKGLPEALESVLPKAEVQLCVIHMIRNSLKYVPYKYSKEFTADLKEIYKTPTEARGESQVLALEEKWSKKYPLGVKPWINNWDHLKTFFKFPEEIKKLIYTTNAVESLHRQFRKVTKTKPVFPSDTALIKILYLASRDVSKKWTMPVRRWKEAISYFGVAYEDRLAESGI